MTNGDGNIPTLNLEGADASDFKIVDESQLNYAFGGRYTSDEYIQVEGENGKPENMHKVTVEMICDHDQFIALMRVMHEDNGIIHVKLV